MAILQHTTTIVNSAEDGSEISRSHETRKLYRFDELGAEVQEKILRENWETNVDHEWWEHIYEDAKTIGLCINGFDLGNKRSIEGELTENLLDCCSLIRKHHGGDCDTVKTARGYVRAYGKALGEWRKAELAGDPFFYSLASLDWGPADWRNSFESEDEAQDLTKEFRLELLQDYYSMLNSEYEYQTSEEQVKASVIAMDHLYTEDGTVTFLPSYSLSRAFGAAARAPEGALYDALLFIGVYPAGIVYADRGREEHGDYKRIAFLDYATLTFQPEKLSGSEVDRELLRLAREHAATVQAKRGELYQISSTGQTVLLGSDLPA